MNDAAELLAIMVAMMGFYCVKLMIYLSKSQPNHKKTAAKATPCLYWQSVLLTLYIGNQNGQKQQRYNITLLLAQALLSAGKTDACPVEATISIGIFCQILLMVSFCKIVGTRRDDFGCNCSALTGY